jgi:peptidoglycan/LPS O-acetylase OafA/YrhL
MGGLDILRFFSAMVVLLSHYTAPSLLGVPLDSSLLNLRYWASQGSYGVHVFFVISGFVIAISATGSTATSFVASRIARLVPTLAMCAALTTAAILLDGQREVSLPMYLANLSMVSWRFGYEYIDGVYWTLAYEAVFYFFVFLILLTRHFRTLFIPAMIGWLALCAIFAAGFYKDGLRTYFLADYAPLFILGGCLYLCVAKRSFIGVALGLSALILALVNERNIILARGVPDQAQLNAGVYFVLAAPVLVWAAAKVQLRRGNRLWTLLGGLSYPLYLLHSEIGRIIFAHWPYLASGVGVLLLTSAMIVLSAFVLQIDLLIRPFLKRAMMFPSVFRK